MWREQKAEVSVPAVAVTGWTSSSCAWTSPLGLVWNLGAVVDLELMEYWPEVEPEPAVGVCRSGGLDPGGGHDLQQHRGGGQTSSGRLRSSLDRLSPGSIPTILQGIEDVIGLKVQTV